MCGIAGATGDQGNWIERATRCLHHRGPDRSSNYADCEIQLGHARLAIIDLSPEADQPMFNEDRSLAIIFNGEFYGFQERRVELEARGHKFRTHSDTEVLLKLYEVFGEECLQRVKGMFAFAIWDFRKKELFLARDRMGEKPLYYTVLPDGNILFASEIKSLLLHPKITREVNLQALDDYLTYLYIPRSQTIFRGISKLMPAETLSWKDRKLDVKPYWQLPSVNGSGFTLLELQSEIDRLLRRSVQQTLIADVPVGVFLSGGIDSSTIVATASEYCPRLKTFTVVFDSEGSRYDERAPAKLVADRFGAEHHELRISGRSTDLLPKIVKHFDQPFGNPTALLTYQISELTRKEVTVAIGGDGGDEVFGGYPRYRGVQWANVYRNLPFIIRKGTGALSRLLPESTSGFHSLRRSKEFLDGNTKTMEEMYSGWVGYFDRDLKTALYTDLMRQRLGDHLAEDFLRLLMEPVGQPFLDRAIRCDLQSFLPYNVLEYGDKMSMAHSLELRLPFLDADLVSLMARVPGSLKLRGGETKYLLKKIMAPRLPGAILERKKIGFNPPMGVWINNQLEQKLNEYLDESQVRARGYFRPDAISKMRVLHSKRKKDYSLHLWSLLVFEEWHRQYID